MCPLNDCIFCLSESATHLKEYFLKHDHYYGTVNTCLSMLILIGNLLKSGLTVRQAYWNLLSLILRGQGVTKCMHRIAPYRTR